MKNSTTSPPLPAWAEEIRAALPLLVPEVELARMLGGVSPRTLRRWRAEGSVTGIVAGAQAPRGQAADAEPGSRVLYPRAEVVRLLVERSRVPVHGDPA